MINTNLKAKDADALYDLLKVVSDPKESQKRIDDFITAREAAKKEQDEATEKANEARRLMNAATEAMNKLKADTDAFKKEKDHFTVMQHKLSADMAKHKKEVSDHDLWYRDAREEIDRKYSALSSREQRVAEKEEMAETLFNSAEKMRDEAAEKIKSMRAVLERS